MNDCVFCRIVAGELPAAIVHEDDTVLAMMDLYPATRGHVLVLPKEHIEDLYGVTEELGARLMTTVLRLGRALHRSLKPDGLNVIQSNGATAGQTVSHLHIHLVPRYVSDAVSLDFGHGTIPDDLAELKALAALIGTDSNSSG